MNKIGESIVGAMAAVASALVDALSEFGISHVDMPATSERLWRLMQQKPTEPAQLMVQTVNSSFHAGNVAV